MLTPAAFRERYPEFSSVGAVSTALTEEWTGSTFLRVASVQGLHVGRIISAAVPFGTISSIIESLSTLWYRADQGPGPAPPLAVGTPVTQESTITDALIERAGSDARVLAFAGASAMAVGYLQAHIVAMWEQETGRPDGGSGVVTREQIGGSYQDFLADVGQGPDVWLAKTAYGRTYLQYRRRSLGYVMGGAMVR